MTARTFLWTVAAAIVLWVGLIAAAERAWWAL